MKDRGVVKRVIVTPDKHVPLHDVLATSVVRQAIEIIKPDIYIDLGDLGEWGSVSHWQWKRKKKPPQNVKIQAPVEETPSHRTITGRQRTRRTEPWSPH